MSNVKFIPVKKIHDLHLSLLLLRGNLYFCAIFHIETNNVKSYNEIDKKCEQFFNDDELRQKIESLFDMVIWRNN